MVLVVNFEEKKKNHATRFFPLRIKTEQTIFSPHMPNILGIAAAVLCGGYLVEGSICSHISQI